MKPNQYEYPVLYWDYRNFLQVANNPTELPDYDIDFMSWRSLDKGRTDLDLINKNMKEMRNNLELIHNICNSDFVSSEEKIKTIRDLTRS